VSLLVALTIGALFGAGVHLMTRGDTVKLSVGTVLISNAAILLLVAPHSESVAAPVHPIPAVGAVADPLVQAIALTAIVIGLGTTVLLLRVALAVERTHHTIETLDLSRAEAAQDRAENEGLG
jgi:multicomponent Na+:H+ antiporter subunit C